MYLGNVLFKIEVNGNLEKALGKMKREFKKGNILNEIKKKSFYEKPSEKKRRKKREAKRKMQKKLAELS
ncbi:MAG: 30S ribosomal protein S21 [Candidatus Schekmanbacteria bacterium]|nr:MAG: 30S ribosomal protein S21 [Candidatus Schekmanbacteria bacterium]